MKSIDYWIALLSNLRSTFTQFIIISAKSNSSITRHGYKSQILPNPAINTILQRARVHTWTALVGNLIMMNLHKIMICKILSIEKDKPPDSQWESEPDGDCVNHYAKVGVKQHKYGPGKRKLKIYFQWQLQFCSNLTMIKYWKFWKFEV